VGPQDVPAGPLAVDTDVFSFIHLRKGRHAEFAGLLAGHPLAMPFPVVGELKVGAIRGKVGERKRAVLEADIATCVVIPTDAASSTAGLPSKHDSWAVSRTVGSTTSGSRPVHDLPLATNNLSDFRTIAGEFQALRLVHPDL
jgi:predicted nucleic acid-binding protein